MKTKITNLAVAGLMALSFACTHDDVAPVEISQDTNEQMAVYAGWPETFEGGSKTSYAGASVTLGTGSWYLTDALIGTTTSDRKSGSKSVRMTNSGKVTMQFNLTKGAGLVTVKHAVYGTDAGSSWELYVSTNSGSTWMKRGSTISTTSTTLNTASFTVNVAGNVRFEIRKITGSGIRINIDDITINDYVTTTSGGGGGGGTGGPDGSHSAFGNPSNATTSTSNENNYLMQKAQFHLSYNRSRAIPNWVSWYVGNVWLGSAPRQDDFRADNTLPAGWYQVGSSSYSGSGFDRGHNCPSADRTSTVADNSATFLMTNMIPQAPTNNQQTWARLEDYTRTLVSQGYECYVIMGSYGTGGTGSNGTYNTINNGNITVPNRIWKVIVVLPQGTGDVNRVTTSTRVIAVNTPNVNSISTSWGTYRTSVDAIEAATGYDILSALPDNVEATLEAAVDNGPTQ
ncbi:MAG: DNA/RNA non-specific endonuclease [Cytophagales bacterium]|nr:DNA/RNA non-specific endonuclease [Cytophagales bacterium]